eukprot:403364977
MTDSCSQCNHFFNLTTRRPIVLECTCIWCIECINFNLKDNPKREIYCPLDKEVVTMPVDLKESKQVLRKLESLDQLSVFCDDHEGQTATQYCITCQIPTCSHCKLVTHSEHSLIDLKQSSFKIYTSGVMKLLDEYSVENIKSQLFHLSTNESQLKSSQFKEIINKVNRMLGHVVSEEEYLKIDLAQSLEDPLYNPQNRLKPKLSNMVEEQKNQSNLNSQSLQQMINLSQSKIREEFKNTMNAFEINQNQINNQNNESVKLIKTSQDNFLINLEQFKRNLETKMTNFSDKCSAIEISFETQNLNIMKLDKSYKSLNDINNDYSQKQKLLQNKIEKTQIELNEFVKKVKQDIDKHDTLLLDAKTQIANERSLLDTLQLKIQEVNENNSNNSCDFLEDQVSKPNDDDVDDNDDDDDDNDQDEDDNENEDNDRELMTYQIYGKELMRRYFRELVDVEIQKQQTSLLQSQIADSSNKQFSLLYRGSRDGFSADKFHELCDYKGPTVSFIISECAQVFGGFTSIPWTSNSLFYSDPSAFVFSLRCTYELPNGYEYKSGEARSYLAGQDGFKALEIEVYLIK